MRIDHAAAVAHFAGYDISKPANVEQSQWLGSIENCDVCSRPMTDELYMIDGPAEKSVPAKWGNLCVVCAIRTSPNIGWGVAQLYKRKISDWYLVAGGPPSELICE